MQRKNNPLTILQETSISVDSLIFGMHFQLCIDINYSINMIKSTIKSYLWTRLSTISTQINHVHIISYVPEINVQSLLDNPIISNLFYCKFIFSSR